MSAQPPVPQDAPPVAGAVAPPPELIEASVSSETEPHAHPAGFTCPNCGTENPGEFCTQCGQKRLHDGDLSLKHAWHHLVHEALHLDGKIFSTLKLLLMRPGQLTLDFVEGRRVRHVHPLGLYLFLSALFVAVSAPRFTLQRFLGDARPVDKPGMSLTIERRLPQSSGFRLRADPAKVEARLREKAAAQGLPYEHYAEHANTRFGLALKIGYAAGVAANGLLYALLFRRRFAYLAEHVVFALYTSCFAMLTSIASSGASHWFGEEWPFIAANNAAFLYMLLAARRVYGEPWRWLILKGLVPLIAAKLILGVAVAVAFAMLML
jgi:hypothetical protein